MCSFTGGFEKDLPGLAAQLVELVHVFLGREGGDVHLVAHRAGQGVRNAADHLHPGLVHLLELGVGIAEVLAVAAAEEAAVVVLALGHQGAVIGDHVRPDLVHVGAVRKVDHVGREAAAGTHVDLEGHNVALLAQALLVLVQTEELEMHKAALDAEALHGRAACAAGVLGQLLVEVVDGVVVVVDDVHQGEHGHVAGLEDRLAVGVDDGVVAVDLGGDELFHDVLHTFDLCCKKVVQFCLVGDFVGVGSTNTVVWFCNNWVSYHVNKFFTVVVVVYHVVTSNRQTCFDVVFFHFGFELDIWDIRSLESRCNVKWCKQS